MKAILKLSSWPTLIVVLISACGPTESSKLKTKSPRMDSVGTVIDSVATSLGDSASTTSTSQSK